MPFLLVTLSDCGPQTTACLRMWLGTRSYGLKKEKGGKGASAVKDSFTIGKRMVFLLTEDCPTSTVIIPYRNAQISS
jgi:hypothetical protein